MTRNDGRSKRDGQILSWSFPLSRQRILEAVANQEPTLAFCNEFKVSSSQPGTDIFRSALVSFQAGDSAAAERYARAALRTNPQHFGALSLLGALMASAGRYAAAEPFLRQAASIAPHN
jgi:Flp pilus assembly protein TadD